MSSTTIASIGGTTRINGTISFCDNLLLKIFLLVGNPDLLTHICCGWRSHALSFPLLWTSITVDHRHTRREAYLLRSQSSPLFVSSENSCGDNCDECAQSLEAISIHLPRIQSLEVKLTDASMVSLLKCFSKHKTPFLRNLSLQLLMPQSQDPFRDPILFPHRLPALHSLTLANITIDWTPIRLNKLTYLSLAMQDATFLGSQSNGLSFKSVIDVLKQCPELQSLNVQAHWSSIDSSTLAVQSIPKSDIQLPFLSNISLDQVSGPVCLYLVENIRSSQRYNLTLHAGHYSIPERIAYLCAIMEAKLAADGQLVTDNPPCYATLTIDANIISFHIHRTPLLDSISDMKKNSVRQGEISVKEDDRSPSLFFEYATEFLTAAVSAVFNIKHLEMDFAESFFLKQESYPGLDRRWEVPEWRNLLKNLPMLEDLRVQVPHSTKAEVKTNIKKAIRELFRALIQPRYPQAEYPPILFHTNIQNPNQLSQCCPNMSSVTFGNVTETIVYGIQRTPIIGTKLHSLRFSTAGRESILPRCWKHSASIITDKFNLSVALFNFLPSMRVPSPCCQSYCFIEELLGINMIAYSRNSVEAKMPYWIIIPAFVSSLYVQLASSLNYWVIIPVDVYVIISALTFNGALGISRR